MAPLLGAVAETPTIDVPWRQLTERDVDYLASVVPTHYIYAIQPGGEAWNASFASLIARARREATMVTDYGGYRAVIQHLVAGFEDPHFRVHFALTPRAPPWPGFLVRYRGGRYLVVYSTHKEIPVGAEITACDGRPLNDWIDQLAELEGGPKGLVTTRANLGSKLFIDVDSLLYQRPKTCHIAGADVDLRWSPASSDAYGMDGNLERISMPFDPIHDQSIDVTGFGRNGAWVRLGTMMPGTAAAAEQFTHLIDAAPGLRDKDVVVIDVRGNPGGTYNWFMAFLRGLYGPEYADRYARARLEIVNTILVLSPTGSDDPGFSAEMQAIKSPPDPPMEVKRDPPTVRKLPGGASLISMQAPISVLPPATGAPPPNPVKARVYVLTDYGCASACLSFLDEILRFPGVTQVGTETHVDRRSGGWPQAYDLPSGLGFVRMGRMVREGRKRGENEPWVPTYAFTGDIADTEAVQRWVLEEIVPRDAARR